jgi:hypothetical protein
VTQIRRRPVEMSFATVSSPASGSGWNHAPRDYRRHDSNREVTASEADSTGARVVHTRRARKNLEGKRPEDWLPGRGPPSPARTATIDPTTPTF